MPKNTYITYTQSGYCYKNNIGNGVNKGNSLYMCDCSTISMLEGANSRTLPQGPMAVFCKVIHIKKYFHIFTLLYEVKI